MRRRGMAILWAQYFDKNRSVRMGRRVSIPLATEKPTVEDLYNAAINSGYKAEIDKNMKYPRTWWDPAGAVLIDSMGQKKSFAIKKIAPELQKVWLKRKNASNQKDNKKKKKKQKQAELLRKQLAEKALKERAAKKKKK